MPGGVGDYTQCLSRKLITKGTRVSVLTGPLPNGVAPLPPHYHEPSPRVYRTITTWGWQCWKDTLIAIAHLRPEVLHIQYQTGAYGMHPAINLLPWRIRMCRQRPRLVVTFHDTREPYLFPKAGPLRRWVNRWLAQGCDAVITTNDVDRKYLARCCAPVVIPIGSNIEVSPPPGYDRHRWRVDLGVRHDTFLIAYFGLLTPSKGIEQLLEALAYLNQHHPTMRYQLLLIGGVPNTPKDQAYADSIIARITQSGLRQQVIVTGHVDAMRVSAHLLAADCVALPFHHGASFRNGSLLAAMKHRVAVVTTAPPVTSPTTSTASLFFSSLPPLADGQQVLLVPPGDGVALAEAIARLAKDPPLRLQLSAAAQEIANVFDWDVIATGHMLLYQT